MTEVVNLFAEFNDKFKEARKMLIRFSGRPGDFQSIAELGIFLHSFIEGASLNEGDKLNLLSWIEAIVNELDFGSMNSSFCLHYFNTSAYQDPKHYCNITIPQVMVLKALHRLSPEKAKGSLFDNMVPEIPKLTLTLTGMMKEGSLREDGLFWFLVLNILDYLNEIKNEKEDALESEFQKFGKFVEENASSLRIASNKRASLQSFAYQIQSDYGLNLGVSDVPLSSLKDKALAFRLLASTVIGEQTLIDNLDELHPKQLFWVISAWKNTLPKYGYVGAVPFYKEMDVDLVCREVLGDPEELKTIELTQDEIEKIRGYGDKEIREQLHSYFVGHPLVPSYEKQRLSEEREKSNAPGEISDFNVRIEIKGMGSILVCMPIKSGREMKNAGPDKITERYVYQMLRPLALVPKDSVVISIIIAKETVAATDVFTAMRHNLKLPMTAIVTETYGQFLKKAGLLV